MLGAADWSTKVTTGDVTDVVVATKDDGSSDIDKGSDADRDDEDRGVAPDNDAKFAAALMDDAAVADLGAEDAKSRFENRPDDPPVEQMGLLLTRPDATLLPDDWTRPDTLLANPGPVLRLAVEGTEEGDDVVELARDDRVKEVGVAEREESFCEAEVEEVDERSFSRVESAVVGMATVVVAVVVVVRADNDDSAAVVVVAFDGLDTESATGTTALRMF